MNTFLMKTIFLAASNNDTESTFWMQILVFVLLATSWWVYSLVRNKANRFKDKGQGAVDEGRGYYTKGRRQFKPPNAHIAGEANVTHKYTARIQEMRLPAVEPQQQPKFDFDNPGIASQPRAGKELPKQKMKDLDSGMELLELDFLLSVIGNTEGSDETGLVIRKLGFNELIRRGKLGCVSSYALKTYALNQGNLYGTDIQCEAIKELAERTAHHSQHII
jgi:hypothetical protein